ncbi:MFS transporter [Sulfobacillus thermosulfidooxidans]|uniref:MFS transporter n=1 Tax=Sulfobacillus thermosulfidooxidans TaxID=28034 RepID=UPI0011122381|nr:MFS transporter [Sulfobacillus thermosulfidooxidans]
MVAGLIEAVVSVAIGLFLLIAEPSITTIWGFSLMGLGLVTAILSVALGRNRPPAVVPEEHNGTPPSSADNHQDPSEPASKTPIHSLPEYRPFTEGALVPIAASLPERIGYLREQVSRTRWRYKAKDIQARAAELADIVMKNQGNDEASGQGERPRQIRRLLELFILAQGYESWSNGEDPVFHIDRYRTVLSEHDMTERLADLNAEADLLWEEMSHGVPPRNMEDDAYRQTIDVRIRLERMISAEERLEEIELLRLGYASLLSQWEHSDTKTTEGR